MELPSCAGDMNEETHTLTEENLTAGEALAPFLECVGLHLHPDDDDDDDDEF